MKYCLSVVLGLFLCGTVTAQDHSAHTQTQPATLMQGYGDLHHPVSTKNSTANLPPVTALSRHVLPFRILGCTLLVERKHRG
jgi:hypothetical protein